MNENISEKLQIKISSPVGDLYLVASEQGLSGVHFKPQAIPIEMAIDRSKPAVRILIEAKSQLDEYFKRERKTFDLPLDLRGTEFQKQVWRELFKIPYGVTRSYTEIAGQIKNSKAVRAVGSANGKNPIGIIIPCHRVITSEGKLGGYSGGIRNKAMLLSIENIPIKI